MNSKELLFQMNRCAILGGAPKHGVFDWFVDTYAVPQFRC